MQRRGTSSSLREWWAARLPAPILYLNGSILDGRPDAEAVGAGTVRRGRIEYTPAKLRCSLLPSPPGLQLRGGAEPPLRARARLRAHLSLTRSPDRQEIQATTNLRTHRQTQRTGGRACSPEPLTVQRIVPLRRRGSAVDGGNQQGPSATELIFLYFRNMEATPTGTHRSVVSSCDARRRGGDVRPNTYGEETTGPTPHRSAAPRRRARDLPRSREACDVRPTPPCSGAKFPRPVQDTPGSGANLLRWGWSAGVQRPRLPGGGGFGRFDEGIWNVGCASFGHRAVKSWRWVASGRPTFFTGFPRIYHTSRGGFP